MMKRCRLQDEGTFCVFFVIPTEISVLEVKKTLLYSGVQAI